MDRLCFAELNVAGSRLQQKRNAPLSQIFEHSQCNVTVVRALAATKFAEINPALYGCQRPAVVDGAIGPEDHTGWRFASHQESIWLPP